VLKWSTWLLSVGIFTPRTPFDRVCFGQFKIDQARQLNFDQGLKPVF